MADQSRSIYIATHSWGENLHHVGVVKPLATSWLSACLPRQCKHDIFIESVCLFVCLFVCLLHVRESIRGRPHHSFGSGQGGGASGFHWIINQDITNKALEAAETQASFLILSQQRYEQIMVLFLRMTDLTQISMSSLEQRSNVINISTLQQSVQLANNCLRA